MKPLEAYKIKRIEKSSQFIFLDEHGNFVDSCNSIFSTSSLQNTEVRFWAPFIESVFESILQLEVGSPELYFSKVQSPSEHLRGFYDFSFSKVELEGKKYLLWIIYDYTTVYKEFFAYQQNRNELILKNERISVIQRVLQSQRDVLSKRNLELEKISQFKRKYYETISNGIKTPLNAINGISHMLSKNIEDKDTIEYISAIEKSLNQMKDLVEELIILTNVDKELDFESIEFDICDLLNEISTRFEKKALDNDIMLNILVHTDIPKQLYGNYVYLKHIVNGLIMNTLSLTQNGSINIEFTPIQIENQNRFLIEFKVQSANNKSLPLQFLQKKNGYENGTNSSISNKSIHSEIELRLSIINRFVELHNGIFEIENTEKDGAKVTFSFPYQIVS